MRTLLASLFLFFSQFAFGKIDSLKILPAGETKCFAWKCSDCTTTIQYNIYVAEGKVDTFPEEKIDTINKDARMWCFNKRVGVNLFGMSIKSIKQWGDKSVRTEGETYTIGIERVFLDMATQKKRTERFLFVMYPYEKISRSDSMTMAYFQKSELAGIPAYSNFIQQSGKELFFTDNGVSIVIDSVFETESDYILKLRNADLIKVEKKPRRPEPLGNFKQITTTLLILVFLFLGILALFTGFILFRMIYYLNYILDSSNDFKKMFRIILANEKMSHFVIYAICIFMQFDMLNKLAEHFLGLKFSIFKSDEELVKHTQAMMVVFKKYRLGEAGLINQELLEINA